jgi:hypothetical protein
MPDAWHRRYARCALNASAASFNGGVEMNRLEAIALRSIKKPALRRAWSTEESM